MPTNVQQQHQEELKNNRDKLLARKSRTRRLIQHGAVAEAFIPGSENMTPETFKTELQKLLSPPSGRRIQNETERSNTMPQRGKELRTSNEVIPAPALVQCLAREGYDRRDIEKLVKLILLYPDKLPDGGYIRLRSKKEHSVFILVRRLGSVLEVA